MSWASSDLLEDLSKRVTLSKFREGDGQYSVEPGRAVLLTNTFGGSYRNSGVCEYTLHVSGADGLVEQPFAMGTI